ncbi:PepSY-like domain-containing protein [Cryomorphaceae bacterium]|nr:PepSY-like domain-containing protein [Cryomorphaceae bacterium]
MKLNKWLGALALASVLISCTEENPTPSSQSPSDYQTIELNSLPAPVKNHVDSNFPSSEIAEAKKDVNLGYEVLLDMGWELYYDLNGNHLHTEALSSGDDDTPVPVSSLPAAITTYISQNYPGETIAWAEMDDDEYEVYLSDGTELYFDLNGMFLYAEQDDDIDPANLPATILTYITQNYPNDSIVEAELDDDIYEVYLSSGIELYFDINGVFLGMDDDDDDDDIDPANLPAAIITYINQNYPNDSIVEAELDDDIYEVYLSNGLELYFDINGNFIGTDDDDDIDPANLPAAIITYINQNYPNATIEEAEFEDNIYEIELDNDWTLYFDANGVFLYAEQD